MAQRSGRGSIAVAVVVIVLGAASGCTAGTGTNTPSPGSTSTPTATATPTPQSEGPTSSATDPTDPGGAQWDVKDDGIGPFALGQGYASAKEAAPSEPIAECETGTVWADPVTGQTYWIARAAEGGESAPVDTIGIEGGAGSGSLGSVTAEGVGIGSPTNDVWAVYPDAAAVTASDGSDARYIRAFVGDETVYFAYKQGENVVNAIMITSIDEVPTTPCG